jgi:hypothetical protein
MATMGETVSSSSSSTDHSSCWQLATLSRSQNSAAMWRDRHCYLGSSIRLQQHCQQQFWFSILQPRLWLWLFPLSSPSAHPQQTLLGRLMHLVLVPVHSASGKPSCHDMSHDTSHDTSHDADAHVHKAPSPPHSVCVCALTSVFVYMLQAAIISCRNAAVAVLCWCGARGGGHHRCLDPQSLSQLLCNIVTRCYMPLPAAETAPRATVASSPCR